MKKILGIILATATALLLSVPALASEEDGLALIAERENYAGILAETVNSQIEEARRAAEEARRAAERAEQARKAAAVQTAAYSAGSSEGRYLGVCEVTAYCACEKCCGKSDGITATGTTATQGRTVAVDPSVIPYGSIVIINGHEYIAEDCGGGIGGTQIDMFFNSHQDALNWGRRWLDVWVRSA